jgi:Domain of unknown function (DUF4274)
MRKALKVASLRSSIPSVQLSKDQRKNVTRALAKNNPTKLESADELHQFAHQVNWDVGCKSLLQLIEHPLCDRGTALLVYWNGSPEYYLQFTNSTEAKAAKADVGNFKLLEKIEQKLLAKTFASEMFRFDACELAAPSNAKRTYPEVVLGGSPGTDCPSQELSGLQLRALTAQEQTGIDRHIRLAFSVLKKHKIESSANAFPLEIVQAIATCTELLRKPSEKAPTAALRELGYLFCEQLTRAFSVPWLTRDHGSGVSFFVYTRDTQIAVSPVRLANHDTLGKYYTLRGLFDAFGKTANDGKNFQSLLTDAEAKHLFESGTGRGAGSWPVWGVHFGLPPVGRTDQ